MIILGIESSCDETGVAIVERGARGWNVRSQALASQVAIHRRFGGVVPEVAARNHTLAVLPMVREALRKARLSPSAIDRIAVTTGPGLVTSLIVGVETARTLSCVWDVPVVAVNHLHGHLYAGLLERDIVFPAVVLIVSGGHTELVLMQSRTRFRKIGATLDDAAGECFDKVGQLLGLPYPGGPSVSRAAELGDASAYAFPRPMLQSNDFTFSFSGLKTAVRYTLDGLSARSRRAPRTIANISASFQQAVVDVLVEKTLRAAAQYRAKTVVVSGGVAANRALRSQLASNAARLKRPPAVVIPRPEWCTDNGTMIALAGAFASPVDWRLLRADPSLEISA